MIFPKAFRTVSRFFKTADKPEARMLVARLNNVIRQKSNLIEKYQQLSLLEQELHERYFLLLTGRRYGDEVVVFGKKFQIVSFKELKDLSTEKIWLSPYLMDFLNPGGNGGPFRGREFLPQDLPKTSASSRSNHTSGTEPTLPAGAAGLGVAPSTTCNAGRSGDGV